MGLFSNIKNLFKKNEKNYTEKNNEKEEVLEKKQVEEVKTYEKGLTKTRENFVSRLVNLTRNHHKIDEE